MKKILLISLLLTVFLLFSCGGEKKTLKQIIREDFTYLTTDDHVFEYITFEDLRTVLDKGAKTYVYLANNNDVYSNRWIPIVNDNARTEIIYILDYKALSENDMLYFENSYSLSLDLFPQLVCFNYNGKNMFSTYLYVSTIKSNDNFLMGVVQLFNETIS